MNVLLEAIQKDIKVIGEDQRGLRKEFGSFKTALLEVGEDVKFLKVVTKRNTEAIERNTEAIERIEKRLDAIDNRLTIVESKVPA